MALLEASRALSTSLVLEEVMDLVCKGVEKAFGLTSVDIYTFSAERDEITAVWSISRDDPEKAAKFVGTVYSLTKDPNFRRAFEQRKIVEYHVTNGNLAQADPELVAEMREWGEKSVLEVALVFGDEIMGLLSVGSTDRPLQLDDVEKELLIAFASTAAIALHNARLYHTIEEQAIHDGLTELFNHRHFYERLQSEVARSRRYGTPVSLLMIDIDDFKRFNDDYGHQTGDEALRAVSAVLAAEMRRDVDSACRYGGEEFAVILPNTTAAAAGVAERLRRKIEKMTFTAADGRELGGVRVSIGVAVHAGATTDVDRMVSDADKALYLAKSRGKNCVQVAAGA
jgi:diguanylate cyclase (GGDEF)-like protein